jgi:hypothetical protein
VLLELAAAAQRAGGSLRLNRLLERGVVDDHRRQS